MSAFIRELHFFSPKPLDFGWMGGYNALDWLGDRLMARHQALDLVIGVRLPVSQPYFFAGHSSSG